MSNSNRDEFYLLISRIENACSLPFGNYTNITSLLSCDRYSFMKPPSKHLLLMHFLLGSILWSVSTLTHPVEFEEMDLQELGEVDVFAADIFQAHLHHKDEWMFAYHFQIMHMLPMASEQDKQTSTQVLQQYPVTPTKMDMHMHMFHLMYAPSDDLTTMLMWQYIDNEMQHVTRSGNEFETHADGLGDIVLGANYKFYESDTEKRNNFWYGITRLSIPTGSIDQQSGTPAGLSPLPYPMQLGSGSYQLELGVGYTSTGAENAWGVLSAVNTTLNENKRNYKVGDELQLDIWYKKALRDNFSISLNGSYSHRQKISGQDPRLDPALVPTADPSNQGHQRLDLTLGLVWLIGDIGKYQHSIGVDYTKPVWQEVNGVQLQNDWNNSIYWQMNF